MNDPFATLPPDPAAGLHPEWIGRYRVQRVLGKGSYGLVYLALDEQLSRPVAIKVPHSRLLAQAADAGAHLIEARTVAHLDHPHIVPVYDIGNSEQFPFFVVSKYIDGTDLGSKQRQSPLSLHDTVKLVATVAEALHHAHKQGLVHRDIKPANLLLDKGGKVFVGDFGLALREQDVGKGPRLAGTPAYMSPEQARGEGHRVDGRSDIFSLGVVLYELLTGRLPFRGDSRDELFEQINLIEARPPRMIDDSIPKELEQICLKALSKRATDRYSTALDMAGDLRAFVERATTAKKAVPLLEMKGHLPALEESNPSESGRTGSGQGASSSSPSSMWNKRRIILGSVGAMVACLLVALLAWPRQCSLEEGKNLLERRQLERAISCFEKIIARDPASSQEAFYWRAEAYHLTGDDKPRQALAKYEEARNEAKSNCKQAIALYRLAYQLDPALFWAANNAAFLLATSSDQQARNLTHAAEYAEVAFNNGGSKCWQVLDTLAVVRAAQQDFNAAAHLVQQALDLAPEDQKEALAARLKNYQNRQLE